MLFLKRREDISSTQKNMCHIENETLKDVEWFVKFCSGDFALKYVQRSGRPSEVDASISRSLSIQIDIVQLVILQRNSLYRIHGLKNVFGHINKLYACISDQFKDIDLRQYIFIYCSLPSAMEFIRF